MGPIDHCILKPSCKGVIQRIMSIYHKCLKSSPGRLEQAHMFVRKVLGFVFTAVLYCIYLYYRVKLQVLLTCNMYKVWFHMV